MQGGGVADGGTLSEEKRLGQVVQDARRKAGLTQQALCQKSGLSYSTLAKIERGAIKAPSVFTIQHIAATLGTSLDQLLQGVPLRAPSVPRNSVREKKVSRSGIRFVYFDMNDCLVRYGYSVAAKLAEDAGSTADVVESLVWKYDADINRGTMSMDEFNTALAERLGMMVDWNRYYLEAIEVMPGMAELVQWAAENYKIGILTNTVPGVVEPMLANGPLPQVNYDAVVQSCEVHALKPETEIFQAATERAGVSPEEILLVDDNRSNIAAASRFGWHVLSFDQMHPEASIVSISTALQPQGDELNSKSI